MTKNKTTRPSIVGLCLAMFITQNVNAKENSYAIVDTGQTTCYNNTKSIDCPGLGADFDGVDALYQGNQPAYNENGDGTVTDINTSLMWQQRPSESKSSFAQAKSGADKFNLAGYNDWRLPTVKELYSLIDFRGQINREGSESVPYINTDYFDFYYGDTSKGERDIDCQYWSSTEYTGTTMGGNQTAFGVNFADGRIKGYPTKVRRNSDKRYVRYVRGNKDYGENDFINNGNGTVTDEATALTWMQADSQTTKNWQQALNYAENFEFAGYDDWRLPNAKELHSIVDYSKSPAATSLADRGPAIDSIFDLTETESWFWTSTTHLNQKSASAAVYFAFGQAKGYWGGNGNKEWLDVHGAGAQRSDPKSGNPANYSSGRGPQGDEVRIYNYVRLVRGGDVTKSNSTITTAGNYEKYATKAAVINTSRPKPQKANQSQANSSRGGQNNSMKKIPSQNGMIQHLDRDHDGRISKTEFPGPPQHFERFDINNDGYLSEDEAPQGPPPPKRK